MTMLKSCSALRTRTSRRNERRRLLMLKPLESKLKSKLQKMKILQLLSEMNWTPSMFLMTIMVRKLPPQKRLLKLRLLSKSPSLLLQKISLEKLRLRKTKLINLLQMQVKIRMKVMLPQLRIVINVAAVIIVVDAMEVNGEVAMVVNGEVAMVVNGEAVGKIGETIGETVVADVVVTEAVTAAAVVAIASQTKTKTDSLWRLERSLSHVTEATTIEADKEVTVVNLEVDVATVATVTEIVVVEVAVAADLKPLMEVTTALPAKNNSQLLAKLEHRQAQTNKVKCE